MNKQKNEFLFIVDDILLRKPKTFQNHFMFFNKGCKHMNNFHPHVHYTKHVTILYESNHNLHLLKPKVMKLTYMRKTSFNINGTTIHFALKISLHKNITKVNALNDNRCETFIKTYDQHHLLVTNKISLIGNKVLSFINRRLHVTKQVHNEFMGGLNVTVIGDYIKFPLSKIHGFSNQQLILLILECYVLQQSIGQNMYNVMNYNKACDKTISIKDVIS